ncbi:MAG: histone deacetylase [Proteobacteria bacterium]|nr:histone deacetylase [Pseudomonadota bacterium]
MKVCLIYDDIFLQHHMPPFHPESVDRLKAILEAIKNSKNIEGSIEWLKPRKATKQEVTLVHDEYYYDFIMNSKVGYLDSDTYLSEGTKEAALYAVGAVLTAIESITEERKRFFCLVRPPGHHAERDEAMGFCIFNNVAVGAEFAKSKGYKRSYIVDFDVHHGNGTQHIFQADPDVFYFSTHQSPLYPGTGRSSERGIGAGEGTTLNIPLRPGAGDAELIEIYSNDFVNSFNEFNPEILFVSAGYDLRDKDPLASLNVTKDGIRKIVNILLTTAKKIPVIFSLEGGYNLSALAESVVITIEEMIAND